MGFKKICKYDFLSNLCCPSVHAEFFHMTHILSHPLSSYFLGPYIFRTWYLLVSYPVSVLSQKSFPLSISWELTHLSRFFSDDISSLRSFILPPPRSECAFFCGLIAICSCLYYGIYFIIQSCLHNTFLLFNWIIYSTAGICSSLYHPTTTTVFSR